MHAQDKHDDLQMGKQVGYTVLVLVGLMFALIILANLIG